ncbi:hypothetical protein BP00DRAFT_439344 [Aspergillus indologenus CBS 114.80]|uniref:Alpha/beta-hydrolase n=1 Tax=Aspergillus indologenus CBS 114.80 TaxID=1450541 RepID=A0A2V5J1S8_9EURO|nr:hypothetical protein BP00DRAFT_439344 [Aspergillus indologenus CBS 114.80]
MLPTTILIGSRLGYDTLCQTYFKAGLAADVGMFGTGFDSDFYRTASNFTGSTAGDLLKFEAIEPNTLNVITGMTADRFQYTTQDLHGTLIPATGFIGMPYTSFRPDPIFAGCPPTITTDLYNYHSWSLLIEDGYAVVAPDCAGLGHNATLHEYLSFPAHANNLYYPMVAALKARGGGAVWKLSRSELVKTRGAREYLGTVALGPASSIYDIDTMQATMSPTKPSACRLALKRVIPWIDLSFFSDTFLQRVQIAELAQACYYSIMSLGYGLTPSEIIINTSALVNNVPFQAWQNATASANGSTAETPMLIVQGLNDTAVLPEITLHMSLYADMDHTDVLTASSPEWLVTEVESSEVIKSLM